MNEEYEAWFKSGVHRSIKCVDCHLPNDNIINYLVWKGIDGSKDIISFGTRIYPDPITISNHGKKTLQANCLRCHEAMVSRINNEGRNCWQCHKSINHKTANY